MVMHNQRNMILYGKRRTGSATKLAKLRQSHWNLVWLRRWRRLSEVQDVLPDGSPIAAKTRMQLPPLMS
jgi:hypothetical protein